MKLHVSSTPKVPVFLPAQADCQAGKPDLLWRLFEISVTVESRFIKLHEPPCLGMVEQAALDRGLHGTLQAGYEIIVIEADLANHFLHRVTSSKSHNTASATHSLSITGPSTQHGPHHGAQKSTTTGFLWLASITSSSKL